MKQTMVRELVHGYREIFLPSDNTLDRLVMREILAGQAYPKIASSADLIWDIGANIGAATLYFAKTYPNAKIVCFEPSQDIVWDCLKENTNRIRSRVTLCPFGLAARSEERSMNEWRDSTVTRSCKHQRGELVVELPACKFVTPPTPQNVTIVKIDTEGCEVEILDALPEKNRIPMFYIEYHSESDRREIDEILPEHDVVRAESKRKHRGTVCYLHRSIETTEDRFEIT